MRSLNLRALIFKYRLKTKFQSQSAKLSKGTARIVFVPTFKRFLSILVFLPPLYGTRFSFERPYFTCGCSKIVRLNRCATSYEHRSRPFGSRFKCVFHTDQSTISEKSVCFLSRTITSPGSSNWQGILLADTFVFGQVRAIYFLCAALLRKLHLCFFFRSNPLLQIYLRVVLFFFLFFFTRSCFESSQ